MLHLVVFSFRLSFFVTSVCLSPFRFLPPGSNCVVAIPVWRRTDQLRKAEGEAVAIAYQLVRRDRPGGGKGADWNKLLESRGDLTAKEVEVIDGLVAYLAASGTC